MSSAFVRPEERQAMVADLEGLSPVACGWFDRVLRRMEIESIWTR